MQESYPIEDFRLDFGKYIDTLFRQWRLIAIATFLCAFTAGLVSVLLPKSYEARVLIASTKTYSAVSFGSAIETMSEDQLALQSRSINSAVMDREARLESYVQMIANAAVAQVVLDELGDQLDEEDRDVTSLLKMVEGELAAKSDTIVIKVTNKDPVLAAAIANAWGRAYVKQINKVYASSGTNEYYQLIQTESARTKTIYAQAQSELEEFITKNQRDEINRQIGELQIVINSLSAARGTTVQAIIDDLTGSELELISEYFKSSRQNQLLALQSDRQGRQELIAAYINTLNQARQLVFNESAQKTISDLTRYYSQLTQVENQLDNANDMLLQVQEGGEAAVASNLLALTLLKANIYAGGIAQLENIPGELAANQAAVTSAGMAADLEALIASLEARQTTLEREIKTLSDALVNGDGFVYLDAPLDSTGELATTIQNRYSELWETGQLAGLSLQVIEEGNPLEDEAMSRAQALLGLEGLEDILGYSIAETPLELKIQDLEQQVRDLQRTLSEEEDFQQELQRARDLAYQTYTTLATKEAELAVAVQTPGVEVALASPAAVPDIDTISGGKNTAIAAVVGLMLGIGAAFFIEFWWRYKGFEPQPILVTAVLREGLRSRNKKS